MTYKSSDCALVIARLTNVFDLTSIKNIVVSVDYTAVNSYEFEP